MILICNGKYNRNLFTLDIITFDELPGHRTDLNNAMGFLKKTVFDKTLPENYYIIVDATKEELKLKWDEI